MFTAENPGGRNIHFGVREHGMGAILNGMTLSKLRAYGGRLPHLLATTAARPIRLAALMHIPVLYVFTHDSIGVGEDGPTHQPIEQLMSLRAIPGLLVIRPCDANEVAEAYKDRADREARAGDSGTDAAGSADARPHEVRAASGLAKGGYCAEQRAEAGRAADRHRERGSALRRGRGETRRRRASRRAS